MSRRTVLGFSGLACLLGALSACASSSGSSSAAQGGAVTASPTDGGHAGGAASAGGGAGNSGASSGAAGLGASGAGGTQGSSGGSSIAGGASSGGTFGGASGTGAVSGSGGASGVSAGGAGSSGGSTEPFTCTLLFGVSPTGQWFDSGFLQQVDPSRWESIWLAHHYSNLWADPSDSGWSQAFDPYPGPPHACALNSTSPDRVVFVAVNWAYTSAAQWQADLDKIVANLRQKYLRLRRIELMTLTRAPGNVVCAAGGSSSETIIPSWTDTAIAATAAKYPDLVVQAPKFEVPKCADFMQAGLAPQYTDAGAQDVAQLIGAYYAAHP